ncbi:hypothetical protein BDY19DRAFT_998894 [Irpex rosettiformis]|uniref:Uncharacterized protein n=1 Tax=Irpex rosettiformis TaxID=378272 RepID=A0ACB8TM61_9APHY|nr:hypothetical protein BDY19DRAFT_998894 [Irpex rosettiformis]
MAGDSFEGQNFDFGNDNVKGDDMAVMFTTLIDKLERQPLPTGESSNTRKSTKLRSRELLDSDSSVDFMDMPLPNRMKVKRHDGEELEFKEHIRAVCARRMCCEIPKSPFNLPDNKEVDLYGMSDGKFGRPSFDAKNPEKRLWKFDVSKTVTKYLRLPNCRTSHSSRVRKAVMTHWKALNHQWKTLNMPEMEEQEREKLVAASACTKRYSNRKQLAARHTEGALRHPDSMGFKEVLSAAGVKAHSDDELVVHNGIQYAQTEVLQWRSTEFAAILRICDSLHLSTKFTPDGRPKTHVFPHVRITGKRVSERGPVPDLPENCYCERWKKRMGADYLETLCMRPSINLKLSQEIIDYAQCFVTLSLGCQIPQKSIGRGDSKDDDTEAPVHLDDAIS